MGLSEGFNGFSDHHRCQNITEVDPDSQPITSAIMFVAGVVGDTVALVLMKVRRKKSTPSLYQVLVTTLLMTDLLGSLSVSPVVLSAYARRKTLLGMSSNRELCSYFGFSMTFLSLSTLAILCVTALERYFSLAQPYFYERHLSIFRGYITIALIYVCSVLFCVAPLLISAGQYVQYCPGTWCFLKMNVEKRVYVVIYASLMLIMTSSTVVCNISVIYLLVMMYRRRQARRTGASPQSFRTSLSMTEEVEHLLPLVIITVVFIFCTFPLILRVYIHITTTTKVNDAEDLKALRFLSCHSIINPWVFIILRPSVIKVIWRKMRPKKSMEAWGADRSGQAKQTDRRPPGAGQ
ncbi:prostaglandin E receptor 2b subtype EP2 [Parambassis ranga]|uniref:Prostaglandin E receptor 2b subtype EP2 n=1 Tax=Parambassis ranga TaxID=210632 RepID=A0A6P7HSD6_9TELE|nr:prostaglandin E2 receptor EP2 subtype-like [Parambassis ranga]